MSLLEQLTADMKTAMKAKDKETLSVVRMVKASLSNEQIKLGHDLTADDEIVVLSREMKQRVEEKTAYEEADREDLAVEIQKQMDVLKRYLPEQLSADEVTEIVKATIAEVRASSKADLGKVMGALMPKVKGKTDGKLVSQTVQSLLN